MGKLESLAGSGNLERDAHNAVEKLQSLIHATTNLTLKNNASPHFETLRRTIRLMAAIISSPIDPKSRGTMKEMLGLQGRSDFFQATVSLSVLKIVKLKDDAADAVQRLNPNKVWTAQDPEKVQEAFNDLLTLTTESGACKWPTFGYGRNRLAVYMLLKGEFTKRRNTIISKGRLRHITTVDTE
jgi:hypothetical protein